MNWEISQSIEDHLEMLENSSCGPAWIRSVIKTGLQRNGKDPSTAPSQKEIGKKVYMWRYGVFYKPLRFRDNWCLPDNVHQYLHRWFEGVAVYEGKGVTIDSIAEELDQGKAVGVLFQDVLPDKRQPCGYQDNLDNGHWTLVTAINLQEDWIELADSYRDKDGNERWFDRQGIVLSDGKVEDRKDLILEHRRIYRMKIADFVKHWWDYKFNAADGKYIHPAVAVDLNSLKLDRSF